MLTTFVAWHWGTKYDYRYTTRLYSSLERNFKGNFNLLFAHPFKTDMHLTEIPGCFARLRMFDADWQDYYRVSESFVCIDLDVVITGKLDDLFDTDADFKILSGANSSNPCPFNGSVMMLRRGKNKQVWNDFSLEAAKAVPFFEFPDDQGWLHHKLPHAETWKCGKESGIYAFQKPGWPKGTTDLPDRAKMVCFPGKRDPSQFEHLKWVRENWV
jgi:hypothetical protein